jgi:3-dehydroquinate dehydratase
MEKLVVRERRLYFKKHVILSWRPCKRGRHITGNRKAYHQKLPTGVQMHDLDLTDINVMNRLILFTT